MKERPIIFSGSNVRAIIERRKRQTRRIAKLPPAPNHLGCWEPTTFGGEGLYRNKRCTKPAEVPEEVAIWHTRTGETICCPYGRVGDRLWVREAWRPWSWHDGEPVGIEFADGQHMEDLCGEVDPSSEYEEWYERIAVGATGECAAALARGHKGLAYDGEMYHWENGTSPLRWRPSIHMPRWASRITLEITDVRVQRLQEISEEDARAEGIQPFDFPVPPDPPNQVQRMYGTSAYFPQTDPTATKAFHRLWDSINGKRAPWQSNPWVWALEFKQVSEACS